ncbi:MAG TPA: VOC family protein [Planctomycetota bacterium]|nr:VOC family protein [Planctomycetota bacterium]HRR79093.1 VOC family protein [Planctomycetota bacterium]HRT93174.1 VOC family protein [Planctomycetota bacterium]
MVIEHLGLNVPEPAAMADWYVAHLGLRVVLAKDQPVPVRFLADSAGRVMLEVYRNPAVPVPDYWAIDPLVLHLAFTSGDVPGDYRRFLAAGATAATAPNVLPTGDEIAIVRDPWGFAVQLVRRARPML